MEQKICHSNLPQGEFLVLTTTFKAITHRNEGKLQEEKWQKSNFNCREVLSRVFYSVYTELILVPLLKQLNNNL